MNEDFYFFSKQLKKREEEKQDLNFDYQKLTDSHLQNLLNYTEPQPKILQKSYESVLLDLAHAITDFSVIELPDYNIIALVSENCVNFIMHKDSNTTQSQSSFTEINQIQLQFKHQEDKSKYINEIFFDPEALIEKEQLYTCDFGYLRNFESQTHQLLLACAGLHGIIHLISLNEKFSYSKLQGHVNSINRVAFASPNSTFPYENILLSCSNDSSTIVWNVLLGQRLAIFRPEDCPELSALWVSWHITGSCFFTVYSDSSFRCWKITDDIISAIENEESVKSNNAVYNITKSVYETSEPHKIENSIVQEVELVGYEIISKDAKGNIMVWVPDKDQDTACIVLKQIVLQESDAINNCLARMNIQEERQILTIGGNQGCINIYYLKKLNDAENQFHNNRKKTKPDAVILLDSEVGYLKKIYLSKMCKFLIAVTDQNQIVSITLNESLIKSQKK